MKIIEFAKSNLKKHSDFVKYVLIGFTGIFWDFGSFFLLVNVFHVNELIANPVGMVLGIVNNFLLNAYFNFKKTDRLFIRFLSFLSIGIIGIFISDFVIFLIHRVIFLDLLRHSLLSAQTDTFFNVELTITKGFAIVLIAFIQFFLNKRFSFKK
ncbi:GtrA family protein [Candidatus Dojkabacteria bacterium]|jgi:putative flippase GtrA|nr:GtrA family protein [Candidatus Dojkabacteria bacterium]